MDGALKGIFVSNSHNYKNMTNDIEFPNLTSNFYHVSSIFYRHFHYDYHTSSTLWELSRAKSAFYRGCAATRSATRSGCVVTLVALKAAGRKNTLGELVPIGEIGKRCKFRTHSWWQAGSSVLARARGRGEGMVVPLVDLVVPESRAVELSYFLELWRDCADLLPDGVTVSAQRASVKATSSSVGLDDLLQHVRDHVLVPEMGHLYCIPIPLIFFYIFKGVYIPKPVLGDRRSREAAEGGVSERVDLAAGDVPHHGGGPLAVRVA